MQVTGSNNATGCQASIAVDAVALSFNRMRLREQALLGQLTATSRQQ